MCSSSFVWGHQNLPTYASPLQRRRHRVPQHLRFYGMNATNLCHMRHVHMSHREWLALSICIHTCQWQVATPLPTCRFLVVGGGPGEGGVIPPARIFLLDNVVAAIRSMLTFPISTAIGFCVLCSMPYC